MNVDIFWVFFSLLLTGSVCFTCKNLGDIANLMYCSVCGEHYHGTCVGLAQMPGEFYYIILCKIQSNAKKLIIIFRIPGTIISLCQQDFSEIQILKKKFPE